MNVRHPEKIHKKSNPIPKKPPWIRVKAPTSNLFKYTSDIIKKNNFYEKVHCFDKNLFTL